MTESEKKEESIYFKSECMVVSKRENPYSELQSGDVKCQTTEI